MGLSARPGVVVLTLMGHLGAYTVATWKLLITFDLALPAECAGAGRESSG